MLPSHVEKPKKEPLIDLRADIRSAMVGVPAGCCGMPNRGSVRCSMRTLRAIAPDSSLGYSVDASGLEIKILRTSASEKEVKRTSH